MGNISSFMEKPEFITKEGIDKDIKDYIDQTTAELIDYDVSFFVDIDGDVCVLPNQTKSEHVETVIDLVDYSNGYYSLTANVLDLNDPLGVGTVSHFNYTEDAEKYILNNRIYSYDELDELLTWYNDFITMETL